MKSLKISDDVSLPLDVVTDTIAILAKRRAGKSYTMRRIAEQLLATNQQVVIVDPKGDQWGIRSSADGKKAGYPIIILGGEHGDLPLEVNAGEVVAKLVVEERVSVLLDLSEFRKHEIATFMAIFLENLYRMKAQERYRTPAMLVVDEADAIAPQKPQRGEERMLGAIEDIVRRGGQRGIGCILVTQRSAVLNKNVLTQAQMLIVLRTIAPQDLAAMKAWIDVHGTPEQGKELMDSLPSLPIGDAWFWSPGGIFKRSHVLPIETFDSGATPKAGEKKIVPKNLADVDLDVLKKQMSATIEKAKADDPKALRAEIAGLKKLLVAKNGTFIEKQVYDQGAIDKAVDRALATRDKQWEGVVNRWVQYTSRILTLINNAKKSSDGMTPPSLVPDGTASHRRLSRENGTTVEIQGDPLPKDFKIPKEIDVREETFALVPEGDITNPEQRVLDAVAWMESVGIPAPQKEITAFLSGYAHMRSKGFTNPCGSLRARGFIDYPSPGCVSLTEEGRKHANFPDVVNTTEELQRIVLDRLDEPKRRVLKPLLESYPEPMSNSDLALAAGYAHERSKGYTNPRGALRSFGLIDYPSPGTVVALPVLFLER